VVLARLFIGISIAVADRAELGEEVVTEGLTQLGARTTEYRYDTPLAAQLEVFANPSPNAPFVIGLDCLEFTSLCPVTGQPDYGLIYVSYVPQDLCVESKSLKLYLGAYRNHGAFHEACVNQITFDLVERLAPRALRTYGDFNARGGIAIKPLVVYYDEQLSSQERSMESQRMIEFDTLRRSLR
jgi:7-cyano-7-deazaguanine reductase